MPTQTDSTRRKRNEQDERNSWLALLFLLFSCGCIFCSSQVALLTITQERINASMLADQKADYVSEDNIFVAPLRQEVKDEVIRDETRLTLPQTPQQGEAIVVLPQPVSGQQLTPTPLMVILLASTPTPTLETTPGTVPGGSVPNRNPLPHVSPMPNPPTPNLPTPYTLSTSRATATPLFTPLPIATMPLPIATTPLPIATTPLPMATTPLPVATLVPIATVPIAPTSRPTSRPTATPIFIATATSISTPSATATPISTPSATATWSNLPKVAFSAPIFNVSENETKSTITVLLDHASALTVTVQYSSTTGTALAEVDYRAVSGTLIFAPAQTQTSFIVPIFNDDLTEGVETVNLTLSAPHGAILVDPSQATLFIADAPFIQFSAPDYIATEIDRQVTLTVTINMTADVPITAYYHTLNNTAIAGRDYLAQSGPILFAPGETRQIFTLTIIDDIDVEMDETFTVILNDVSSLNSLSQRHKPNSVYLPIIMKGQPSITSQQLPSAPPAPRPLIALSYPTTATVTIISDDQPTVQFSQSDYSVKEDGGAAVISVTLDAPVSWPILVSYTTSNEGIAIPNQDYSPVSGILTFAPGQTWQTFNVPILDDTFQELTKTVQLMLSSTPTRLLTSTLTILDNDHAPQVQFSQATYLVSEAAPNVTITLTLSAPSELTVTVEYRLSSDTYPSSMGTLVFPPRATTAYLQLPIFNNAINEPPQFVSLTLQNPLNAELGTIATSTLTITDDDEPPTVQFSQPQYFINESETSATIALTLSAPSGFTTTVQYTTVANEGTAMPDHDYTPVNGQLTFAPGQTRQSFTIPLTDNLLYEPNKTIGLLMAAPTQLTLGAPTTALLTIIDNDPLPTIQLSSATYRLAENDGTAIITVTLSQPAGMTATVDYASSDDSAWAGRDYTAVSDTLTFAPGQTWQTFTVPISDNLLVEADKILRISLSNSHQAILATPASATITIINDDTYPTIQFSQPSYTIAENGGAVTILATLSKSPAITTMVAYSASNGTALAGQDYVAWPGTLTFAPPFTTVSFTIPISDNSLVAPNKTFTMRLISVTNALISPPDMATVTIIEDDSLQIQFATAKSIVSETVGAVLLTVTLNTASSEPVMVDSRTVDGSAIANSDYVPFSHTLQFVAGQTILTLTVPIINDAVTEPTKNFMVSLSQPRSAVSVTLGLTPTTEVAILDDDTPTVQFSRSSYAVNEADGQATLTATLNFAATIPTTVTYYTSDGTATAGHNYTAVTNTLTFAAGQTTAMLTIPIMDNAIIEPNVTFTVSLSQPLGITLGTTATATVSIIDDDTPAVQFTTSSTSVNENDGAVILGITLSKAVNATVTVAYNTTNGTALAGSDYSATSGNLTFVPYQISRTLSIPIINDTQIELSETFLVTLSNLINSTLGTPYSTTVTILDDDVPTVQFTQNSYSINENGGTVTLNVTLSQPSVNAVTVNYVTSNGTASAGTNYGAVAGTLTFAPGQTVQSLGVGIINDGQNSLDRTFNVALSNPVKATLGTPNFAVVTIIDTNFPQARFSSSNYAVNENGSSVMVTVQLSLAPAKAVTVNYGTSNGTAIAATDYNTTNSTLIFNIGETSKSFTVPIINNSAYNGDKTFAVTLNSPSSPAILGTPSAATVVIVDDETPAPMLECHKVSFTIATDTSNLPTVTTKITVTNNYTDSIMLQTGSLVVRKNSDEGSPLTINHLPVPNLYGTATNSFTTPYIIYDFYSKAIAAGGKYLITATYSITNLPLLTTQDTFSFRYTTPPLSGTNVCAYAAPVSAVSPSGALALTINSPTPFQVVNLDSQANFEAIPSPAIASDLGWVNFQIVHVATNAPVWGWVEYIPAFCTFGGNISGACELPSNRGFSWNALTNGTYKLVATAHDFTTGNVATTSQFFIINNH